MNNFLHAVYEAISNALRVRLVDANGADASQIASSSVGDGSKDVTTAGTRVQLSSSSVPCKWVAITAKEANTDTIWVGGATVANGSGKPLVSLQETVLYVSNLNKVYLDSEVNGEGVTYIYGV